ncbi:hypothetical protein OAR96_04345, partial [Euryarchaeota archaeon]|nr:hypothetical protein [Euryarchaeota archaeon]
HPRIEEGALDSITLEQIKKDLENLGIPVRPAKMTISLVLRAKEMIVLGSGMGVQSLGVIDGRKIGTPPWKTIPSSNVLLVRETIFIMAVRRRF